MGSGFIGFVSPFLNIQQLIKFFYSNFRATFFHETLKIGDFS